VCLGQHPHNTWSCNFKTLWDGSQARCRRNKRGRLVMSAGNVLCSDWQGKNSCSSTTHDSKHECSGCSKTGHRAQKCS
ncbi:hypothetical protein FA15DRAFT_602939, partial [Coprinopsis marcescibilis]